MVGIYKITSPSGNAYIGQSLDVKRRIREHKRLKGKGQRKLECSIKSYGVINHTFEIICQLPLDVSQDDLNKYEQIYIDAYRDCGIKLLNLKEGGNGYGKHCEETKEILRQYRAKQVFSEESKMKGIAALKSAVRTKEWIEKVAAANRGKKHTYEHRAKKMRPVAQYTKDGQFIKTWDCSRNAAKHMGTVESNICNNLTGRSKTAAGFKWTYL